MSKLLVSLLLAVSPVLAIGQAVQGGDFPDGAKFMWQCSSQAAGNVEFVFVTPDGKAYTGILSCGTAI